MLGVSAGMRKCQERYSTAIVTVLPMPATLCCVHSRVHKKERKEQDIEKNGLDLITLEMSYLGLSGAKKGTKSKGYGVRETLICIVFLSVLYYY